MRFARSLATLLFLAYSCVSLGAQELWRTYLSYGSTAQVAETPELLFALSEEGTLLSFPKGHPQEQRTYGREDGLSEAQAQQIAYAEGVGRLLIYYPSGAIDLLDPRDGQALRVNDLQRSPLIRDHRLRGLQLLRERAWLSGAFGLVELDLKRGVLLRSALLGQPCEAIAELPTGRLVLLREGRLYAADAGGRQLQGEAFRPLDLPVDFPTVGWQALVAEGSALWLLSASGECFYLAADGLGRQLHFDGRSSGWEQLSLTSAGVVLTRGDRSLLCTADGSSSVLPGLFARHFSALGKTTLWSAARGMGVLRYQQQPSGQWTSSPIRPNLNLTAENVHFALRTEAGFLYSVGGGRNYDRYGRPGVVQCFDGERWEAWTQRSLAQADLPPLTDPVDVLPVGDGDPSHVYVATWGEGLFELQAGKILHHYSKENSPLHAIPLREDGVRVGALARDAGGTLFLAQGMSGSTQGAPVRSLSRSGQWRAYPYAEEREVNAWGSLVILPQGTKWLAEHALTTGAPGVFVFQDKGSATSEDDAFARYTSFVEPSGKPVSFSRITALKVDRASRLWVGMDIGYGRILRPEQTPQPGRLPVLQRPVGGVEPPYYYLLGGLTVTAIEVDAQDRKWLGTATDGLYLVSEDGGEVLAHYTQENSPLVSNSITALAFDDASGFLYIGTSSGLSRLKTQAGLAQAEATPEAYAFPNPLRPEDPPGLTFRDLPAGARIRITDAGGGLCALLESPTAELYWDTRSASGALLPSGIYLATIYPPAGGVPQQLKLALLRP